MNDRSTRLLLTAELVILAAGAAGCCLLHPAAAVILLACCGMMLAVQEYARYRRTQAVLRICDEIGQILRGAEQITLNSYEEGDLGILSAEIRKMTVRLREQNAALQSEQHFMQESLEDISHQLRTPLTSVMLLLDMMRSPQLTRAQQTENLCELQALLAQMQWLIETLLGLSRLDAGAVHFQQEEIRCRDLIAAAIEPISVTLELKDIAIETDIHEDAAFFGDFPYCTEALVNLLKNCMEHTPTGGTIRIAAQTNAIYTGILITDSGAGIAQDDLPHIFERFYRGGSFAKSGYGIGLAFARKIITAQSGSIQVRNVQPHGAQFDLRFYRSAV